MTVADEINLKVSRIKNLPTLSVDGIKILQAVNDPDISIDELATVLSTSPVLVGRLIGLANSAYFGHAGKVNDLKFAIIRVLGFNLVKCLTVGVVLNLELNTQKCSQFDSERFWMDALLTAILAQQFSQLSSDEDLTPSTAYTAGLLLNIGLITAVYMWPEELNQVLLSANTNGSSVSREMLAAMGEHQYELGSVLLAHWHLPRIYSVTLREFKNTNYTGSERRMIDLLAVCFTTAKKMLAGQQDELPLFVKRLEAFGISAAQAQSVIDDLLAAKNNIYTAALAIAGK